MDYIPSRGELKGGNILLVALYFWNRDKLQPDKPLSCYVAFILYHFSGHKSVPQISLPQLLGLKFRLLFPDWLNKLKLKCWMH